MPDRSRIAFRTFLILALLLVLLPIVVASGWFFYRSALSAREEFAQQLADEVSSRVREKIVSFFDVPLRVVTFNVEQARAGQLLYAQPEALMRQFLLQIDQQPQLTFISMGLADGQYYAGSRPPVGADRPLQLLRARIADGRAMEVLRLDEASRALVPVSRSEIAFDARTRPWFQSALARDGMAWYAPYRYLINDAQGAYAAIGMGGRPRCATARAPWWAWSPPMWRCRRSMNSWPGWPANPAARPFWPMRTGHCWPRPPPSRACRLTACRRARPKTAPTRCCAPWARSSRRAVSPRATASSMWAPPSTWRAGGPSPCTTAPASPWA